MAINISGKVWELDLDPVEKLVLLALTDHADSDGRNIRPGNALLCAKTGLSERTISAKITKFIELGILEPTTDGTGRGHVREFEAHLEGLPRQQYFVEKEQLKVARRSTFRAKQKVESDDIKVESDARKVESDDSALIGIIEPSIEPSIEPLSTPAPKSARPANPFYEIFKTAFEERKKRPYPRKPHDFIQLTKWQKTYQEWATIEHWAQAVRHYFESPVSMHTLADIAVRFDAFYESPLDRYNKPLNQNGVNNGRLHGAIADTRTLSDFGIRESSRVI